MAYEDTNYLHNKVIEVLERQPKGRLLDLGSGVGNLARRAQGMGFAVTACDAESGQFKYKHEIEFRQGDLNQGLPFGEEAFDCVVMLEVVEHLENPYFAFKEISRVLKAEARLILSTPNIMNLRSRMRFLFEGTFDFFREPTLEMARKDPVFGRHIFPCRFQELEYILFSNNLSIAGIYTDLYLPNARCLSFLLPLIKLQFFLKRKRSQRKHGPDYLSLHKALLSAELLYGRHLIIEAVKN
ncbi:class I SAM-dependent methyltransferase [Candidatus Omnitrophota bacterium]